MKHWQCQIDRIYNIHRSHLKRNVDIVNVVLITHICIHIALFLFMAFVEDYRKITEIDSVQSYLLPEILLTDIQTADFQRKPHMPYRCLCKSWWYDFGFKLDINDSHISLQHFNAFVYFIQSIDLFIPFSRLNDAWRLIENNIINSTCNFSFDNCYCFVMMLIKCMRLWVFASYRNTLY